MVTKTTKFSDVFEVDHQRVQIPSHSHIYATVTFTPPSMQSFSAIFEAALEGVPQNQVSQQSMYGNLPKLRLKPSFIVVYRNFLQAVLSGTWYTKVILQL